jgi:hypothetical protein
MCLQKSCRVREFGMSRPPRLMFIQVKEMFVLPDHPSLRAVCARFFVEEVEKAAEMKFTFLIPVRLISNRSR